MGARHRMSSPRLRIGTRTSRLALWQTQRIVTLLHEAWPQLETEVTSFSTRGDRTLDAPLPQIGGKGLFTAELDSSLARHEIDLAVHSLKDLPVEDVPALTLAAICEREEVRDALVSHSGLSLQELPQAAIVGTSSPRRHAQLLIQRPDLTIRSIRGNVETRLRKVHQGHYAATILAATGLQRLGLESAITEILDLDTMLPAPGQGALAVQCRTQDSRTRELLAAIHNGDVAKCVHAERRLLQRLGGGCSAPIAAHATLDDEQRLTIRAFVALPGGDHALHAQATESDWREAADHAAEQLLAAGAQTLLASNAGD